MAGMFALHLKTPGSGVFFLNKKTHTTQSCFSCIMQRVKTFSPFFACKICLKIKSADKLLGTYQVGVTPKYVKNCHFRKILMECLF